MIAITSRPSGTVTFLFTDIESSTRLWEQHPDLMKPAHHRQETILLDAIRAHDGYPYKMIGDAFQAAFDTAPQALQAALEAQLALHSERWDGIGELRVRMGIHTGITEERESDYTGPVLNRVARLMSAGHGGQVLLSLATQELVRDLLPPGISLRDLGEHRLKDLTRPEHIFQLVTKDLPSDFPPLKTLDNHPNNLPLQSTPLIGRKKEVEAVRSRLLRDEVRLLTLTGPGGIGKTRLALQAAAEMLDDFPDGVFFVNLASIVDHNLVLLTIAYTLGLREAGGQPIADTLKDYLKDKRLLLLLDNFEHVLDAAPAVADLFKSAPHLKALVTSRATLRLSMEHEYGVPPLSVPDPNKLPKVKALSQYDAVTLFIQRAASVKPGFEVNKQNAPAVAQICYRLEGIPLAVELAAARIKALPPQAILSRLGSRLNLLTGGARDVPARQQTLRNTIEWSYDLLTEEEKQLFRRMAVFRGGRTLEAAEMVCNTNGTNGDASLARSGSGPGSGPGSGQSSGQAPEMDVLDGISSLVDKSLMYVTEGAGGEPRYWMLETIHEYAWEKLQEFGESAKLQRRHALFFMRLAEKVEPRLRSMQEAEWLARLEEEHDNFRAALSWAKETGETAEVETGHGKENTRASTAEIGIRLAGALYHFWSIKGHLSEGREQLLGMLAVALPVLPGVDPQSVDSRPADATREARAARAKALHGAGLMSNLQGDYSQANVYYQESLAMKRELGDERGVAISLNNLGNLACGRGDHSQARTYYEESLAIKRQLGDKQGIASTLGNLAIVARELSDYSETRALLSESLALQRELGDKRGIASSLNTLGNVALEQGDYAQARSLYEEGLKIYLEIGDKFSIAVSLLGLGNVARELGEHSQARSLYEESLKIANSIGNKHGIASTIIGMGHLAYGQGNYTRAHTLYQESLAIDRETGDTRGIANALNSLGNAVCAQGSYLQARSLLEEGLKIREEIQDKRGIAHSLVGFASVELAATGVEQDRKASRIDPSESGTVRAARLLGATDALLAGMGAALDGVEREIYEKVSSVSRQTLGDSAFEEIRQTVRATSVEQAISFTRDHSVDT